MKTPDGVEWSLTVAPHASIRYRGEGKVLPQSYVNRYGGAFAKVYRLDVRGPRSPQGSWGLSLWQAGEFGGGKYAVETIPDNTSGGTYQSNLLNVGFTNFFVNYHRPVANTPVEAVASVSVIRQIFKRKEFQVEGVAPTGMDDVNEISAEGIGFGFTGKHGRRFFARWQAQAHYYMQLFDAKTDASAGHIFQGEGGAGWAQGPFRAEVGGLWQYWFMLGQGNRRLHIEGTDGAVISWNRQETRLAGMYLRLGWTF